MSTLKVNAISDSAGASGNAITLATDGTCTAKLTSIGGNQLSSRNVIINGGMLVAQRGTSSTDTEMKTVDRIQFIKSNTDQLAWTQKQVDDYPDGFSKSYEIKVTTAETALAADELCYIRYKVEAQDLRPFYNASGTGRNFTLSFWVKAKQTGTYQVSIHKEDNGVRFITATYTISAADTWEKKSITFTGDTGTTGINADNGQGFDITWKLAVGTDYTSGGAQTTWGSFSNAVFGGGHAVDFTSSTANYYRITGIQLEVGEVATDFEHRSYGEELARCRRYYHHWIDSWTAEKTLGMIWASYDSTGAHTSLKIDPQMRAIPTLKVANATNAWTYIDGTSDDFDSIVANSTGRWTNQTVELYASGNLSTTTGRAAFVRCKASPDTTYIAFDAEL